MMEWKTIDSAPKNEVDVLVSIKGAPPRVAAYFDYGDDGAGWFTFERPDDQIFPTHWMPLPPPPKDSANA